MQSSIIYWMLVILRILQAVIPQTGYIHPDEFFQSQEIVAGDTFGFQYLKTWEFNNNSNPIRSIVMPYIISAPPLYMLKLMSVFGFNIINTWSMLRLQKLVMTLLSFTTDWCLLNICKNINVNPIACLTVHAGSYVTLVLYNRSLSNTVEVFLFALLLHYVIKDSCCEGQDRSNNNRARTTSMVTVVIILGVFNRPTFIAFAAVPYTYWLLSSRIQSFTAVMHKIYNSIAVGGILAAVFIVCDSQYYKSIILKSAEIHKCWEYENSTVLMISKCLAPNIVVTPINFITYNINPSNLSEHGTHPLWMHMLVNAPMLFGVSSILVLIQSFKHFKSQPIVCETNMLLMAYWIPLVLLSVFPHQELRFIIPLIIPVSILTCQYYIGDTSRLLFKILWAILNLLGLVIFGYMHQGGVLPCLGHLQGTLANNRDSDHQHIIFYKTYMPPRYLLTIPANETHVNVSDLAGAMEIELHKTVLKILYATQDDMLGTHANMYVVYPGSVPVLSKTTMYHFQIQEKFFPHLSTENLPKIQLSCRMSYLSCIYEYVTAYLSQLSLNIYKVNMH